GHAPQAALTACCSAPWTKNPSGSIDTHAPRVAQLLSPVKAPPPMVMLRPSISRIDLDPFCAPLYGDGRHMAKKTRRTRSGARDRPGSRRGIGFVKIPRPRHAGMAAPGASPYCSSMARTSPASASGRSLPVALAQTVYLLLGLLAVSALAGVLLAAFFLPAVSASSAVAKDGVDLFESYPSELEVEPLNEASRIEASDGSLLATFYTENRIMVPIEEISPHMQHAVIAVEDRR